MTLRILCFLALVTGGFRAGAQATVFDPEQQRTFYGGFAIGTNFSQVDGDGYAGYHKVGFNAGPLVYVRFLQKAGASMELLYSRKGSRDKHFDENIYGVPYLNDYSLKLNYIEVPIMLHYFGECPGLPWTRKMHYGAGISYSRLIASKEEAWGNFQINLDPELYPFQKDEFSYLAGLGYEFYPGWFLDFRYSRSITSVRDGNRIPQGFGGGKFSGQYNNLFTLRLMCLIK